MLVDDNLNKIPPKGVKAQRDFILSVLEENQAEFRRIVAEMAIVDPRSFARLYKELTGMVVPKQNELNVNLTLNQDFQELQALGSTGMKSLSADSVGEIESVEYEELDEG